MRKDGGIRCRERRSLRESAPYPGAWIATKEHDSLVSEEWP